MHFFCLHPSETITDPIDEKHEKFKLQEACTELVYEEPAALCKIQKNIAYEIPPSRIKTAGNEAYGSISNT